MNLFRKIKNWLGFGRFWKITWLDSAGNERDTGKNFWTADEARQVAMVMTQAADIVQRRDGNEPTGVYIAKEVRL